MKITVLGASGKTGTEIVAQALAIGHVVYAVSRHRDGFEDNPNLHVIVGDATDSSVIIQASEDSDAILCVLGTTSNKSTVITDAVKATIVASKSTGCKRFILMSSFTVEAKRLKGPVKMAGVVMKGMISDKVTSENHVRSSDLDWTLIYATRLTNQPKGSGVRALSDTEKLSLKNKIARADVAAFMLREAEQNAYIRREVTISQ
jgi:uncharacterized protein YbjT (DUF2867 family)